MAREPRQACPEAKLGRYAAAAASSSSASQPSPAATTTSASFLAIGHQTRSECRTHSGSATPPTPATTTTPTAATKGSTATTAAATTAAASTTTTSATSPASPGPSKFSTTPLDPDAREGFQHQAVFPSFWIEEAMVGQRHVGTRRGHEDSWPRHEAELCPGSSPAVNWWNRWRR
mmetsp:Transcript_52176/g.113628  ORF Transcript_52176/g.113628 Transcript_52176/m.113628 type:complete len:175 (+) Transcript_52176:577-1101(+)